MKVLAPAKRCSSEKSGCNIALNLGGDNVNFCYCDESGTGQEPIAVMVGIVVDCQRMHITKGDWMDLLVYLSRIAGRQIAELHTRNFYRGAGVWDGLDGEQRSRVITAVFDWLAERKHQVVYSSVCKETYYRNYALQYIPDELNTIWRFLGYHLVLAMQKCCQSEKKNKGNTLFVFDNEKREELRFTDILKRPPEWSNEYYGLEEGDPPLNQVIDVPYFGDSRDVALIQLADLASFFLRRYAEIKEGLVPARYEDEEEKVTQWIQILVKRSVGRSHIYKRMGRNAAEELFYANASTSIRGL
ncbi:MAG TPA: DUF3800 domain-containing protein [Candidatus Acidoferrales bacterium]|nr:DUF3800 domain-containing protein [Candidatus Acidoferrales bacterium]